MFCNSDEFFGQFPREFFSNVSEKFCGCLFINIFDYFLELASKLSQEKQCNWKFSQVNIFEDFLEFRWKILRKFLLNYFDNSFGNSVGNSFHNSFENSYRNSVEESFNIFIWEFLRKFLLAFFDNFIWIFSQISLAMFCSSEFLHFLSQTFMVINQSRQFNENFFGCFCDSSYKTSFGN